jgi:exodeoxyribonuclease V alpha subunit
MEDEKILKCTITINKILFPKNGYVEDGNFAIFSATVDDVEEGEPHLNKYNSISVKGGSCALSYAKKYNLLAKEKYDDKWGYQYEICYINEKIKLNSIEDKRIFLLNILTEKQVDSLFETFKDPIKVLEEGDIKKLIEAKGIGEKNATGILEKYENSKMNAQAYIELNDYGLTRNAIDKLIENYGGATTVCKKIKSNPYILMDEIEGYGWEKADKIALAGGIGEYSEKRITAYIKHYLKQEAMNGNSWVYSDDVWNGLDNGIGNGLDEDKIINIIHMLEQDNYLWFSKDRERLGLKRYYNLEYSICKELIRLSTSTNNFIYENYEEKISNLETRQGWNFTDEQKEGVKAILENQVVLVVGSGGTGKTSTVSGMLEVFQDDYTYAQTALSGRASGNLTDVTGREGFTIHRLLGVDPETSKFIHNRKNPLQPDVVILDEISMVGEEIFYSLTKR